MVAILQHAGHFQKPLQGVLAVAEPLDVRDLLVGLQRKPEAFRYALHPIQQILLHGHVVKAVIDFDR
jgi:hypothetical protein